MVNFYTDLIKAYEQLNKGTSIEDALDFIFITFTKYIPYDRIGIVLLDSTGEIYSYSSRNKNQFFLKPGYTVNSCETSLKRVMSTQKPRIISNYEEYVKIKSVSEATQLIINEGIKSSIAYPLMINGESIGVVIFSSTILNIYDESQIEYIKMLAEHIANALEKNLFTDDLILGSINGFAKLVEAKDTDTGLHIERMQRYSKIIARSLLKTDRYKNQYDYKFANNIYKFSPLHDIGKVGIADGILLKPAKLTHEEFEVMKMHTIIGANVLRKSNKKAFSKDRHFFDMGIDITLCHHERYNGSGYPYGVSGENIPLSARIVSIGDVLDALTSKRVYKSAFDLDTSLQFIKDESGKMFDPYIVNAMFEVSDEIIQVYEKFKENIDLSNI